MPTSLDQRAENPPSPLPEATVRGRQRLFYGLASLGFVVAGTATLITGEMGYADGTNAQLLGGVFLVAGVLAARSYRNIINQAS